MIQVLQLPRQLPPAVIWSIYTVTWLGLIVAVIIVVFLCKDDEQRPSQKWQPQQQNNTHEDVPATRLFNPHHNIKLNNSSSKKRRQQQQLRPRARPGFVTLEEVVAYECRFQAIYHNTTWLEGSDTEISYLDAFGQPRVMNVLFGQSIPLEMSEQRVMDLSVPWVGSEDEDVTRMLSNQEKPSRHIVWLWNCPEIQECRLRVWILSSAINEESSVHFSRLAQGRLSDYTYAHEEPQHKRRYWIQILHGTQQSEILNICTTKIQHRYDYIWNSQQLFHRKHSISVRERCPSFSLAWTDEFTFIPHSRRQDVNLQHHHGIHPTAHVAKANGLSLSSSSRMKKEWKDLSESSYHHEKVHVTKMILEAGTRYFVGAPISNVSLRFIYGGEPPRCLTCPGGADAGLECLSSDAMLSTSASYYILYCRGPEVPWTAVVSTEYNKIVYRLDNQEHSREWYASRPRPITHELDVKLDGKHNARVRLHLPSDWKDKTYREDKCIERLRLLLRIADEQHAQMVNAQFDFSLTTYLTTVKGYAVIYADVRASQFQSFDFRHLRFRRRELMQMTDYAKVVTHVLTHFQCIKDKRIGVFGENYGGHMALNLVADNDEQRNTSSDDKFRCGVAFNPQARWQDYVYPFTVEHSVGVTGALRKKMFKRHYMAALIDRLRGKNFALYTTSHSSHQHRYYTKTLLKMLDHHAIKFEHQYYEDESEKTCNWRLKSYESASDFFDRCFGREIDAADY